MPHIPQERGVPLHLGGALLSPPPPEANTESFFDKRFEPQRGQAVPFHFADRTSISLSLPQVVQ